MATATLSLLYGVTKFNVSQHGDYPQVSKSHMEWPTRTEQGKQVPLHRFDFTESHSSKKNKDTYDLWIKTTLNQGPVLAGVSRPSDDEFNQRSVASSCSKLYSSFKSRYKDLLKKRQGPVIRIKRKADPEAVEQLVADDDVLDDSLELGPAVDFSFTEYLQSNSLDDGGAPLHPGGLPDPQPAVAVPAHAPHDVTLDAIVAPSEVDEKPVFSSANRGAPRLAPNNHPDTLCSRKSVVSII